MTGRLLSGAAALAVAVTGTLALSVETSAGSGAAARAGDRGARSTWTEADKTGFGTARARGSNVWFTLQDGRMSEVFYPDLSTPSVRSLELVVTDGETFTDRTSRDTTTEVEPPRPAEPALHPGQHRPATGATELTEEYVTSPDHDSVAVRVRLDLARRRRATGSTRSTTRR